VNEWVQVCFKEQESNSGIVGKGKVEETQTKAERKREGYYYRSNCPV